jgi:hypothetical protein
MGGRPAAHAACAAEFTGGHLCHIAEYLLSNSAATIPAGGAWIDGSSGPLGDSVWAGLPNAGRRTSYSCDSWSHSGSSSYTGNYLVPQGHAHSGGDCAEWRRLACCNGAPKVALAGFTPFPADFNGRPSMHAQCDAAFPGSHMCHVAEYLRTASAAPIPAEGAWLDGSTGIDGDAIWAGVAVAGRRTSYACNSWTHTGSSSYTGNYLVPEGHAHSGGDCSSLRPIACCQPAM